MIDDADFIRLFNAAAVAAKTDISPPLPAERLDQTLSELQIDSLDTLIVGFYLCDAFGVPEEDGKQFRPATVGEFKDLLLAKTTKESINVDEAIGNFK